MSTKERPDSLPCEMIKDPFDHSKYMLVCLCVISTTEIINSIKLIIVFITFKHTQ